MLMEKWHKKHYRNILPHYYFKLTSISFLVNLLLIWYLIPRALLISIHTKLFLLNSWHESGSNHSNTSTPSCQEDTFENSEYLDKLPTFPLQSRSRGSRQRQKSFLLNERIASAVAQKPTHPLTANLNHLCADLFERTHSIRWLTALIFALDAADDNETIDSQEKEKIIQNAAALLASLAGPRPRGPSRWISNLLR